MEPFVLLYKPQGMTPLAVIEEFRRKNPLYSQIKLGAAGRLDPMADGLLLVLVGDENKKRQEYEKLPKTYHTSVLFGCSTDSFDLLGLVKKTGCPEAITKQNVEKVLKKFPKQYAQTYPPFSSKPVNGKPLYWYAREGKLDTITIPEKIVTLHSLECSDVSSISKNDLHQQIHDRISIVKGEFRQQEILEKWDIALRSTQIQSFPIAHLTICCSSGTYMREIANTLGTYLNSPSLAITITRTHIGPYSLRI